ncbi:MAG: MFS transporter [Candidatus Tectomicrobia bacterium]|uniref:MFS transporter n=1 Tax=Tectimicrobiota bacterium TaxID=2528274 RepID=A0A932CME1_UNCTE|nr:MFS transporter [Candidatus Tectomicrobia bacterium]
MSIGKYRDLLRSLGFQSFLWTQFLGALNDNLYKIVISMLAVERAALSGGGSRDLSLVGAVFILPFFLFSGYAGHLADTRNKRTVLIVTKSFEIVAMALALLAFWAGRIGPMLGVLFLMALQSTLFSPAKYGILPEMLPDRDLSRANGLLEMSTFLAIILGTSVGSLIFAAWKDQLGGIGLILIAIALAGTLTSLGISRVPASGARKPFRLSPWAEIGQGIRRFYGEKTLWLTVIGISYFWFLGALLQMDLLLLGKEVMGLDAFRIGILGTFLAVGIGTGSLVAGRLSGDKVELGLVPLGSIGMGIFAIWLASSSASYAEAAAALVLLGFAGGFFIVPLNALLQQKSGHEEKGQLIATANFLSTGGILLASGALWALHDRLQVPADGIILAAGIFTLGGTVYLLAILPDFLIRFSLWMLTHSIYRIRIVGQEHPPLRGPALLVCNHLSLVDGFLVGACLQRFIRFMVYQPFYEMKAFHWLLSRMKAIPVMGGNPKAVEASLEQAREELRQGHMVCIFAEGSISRTGNLLPFKRGFERIMQGVDVPILPVHLDRLWGSIFSFKDGRFLWKWPQRIPYPVTVSFGHPMPATATAQEVRQTIMELGEAAMQHRKSPRDLLHLRFLETARRHWFSFCMADASGKRLTYGKALVGSLLLARWIRRQRQEEPMVGILLPASIGGALANIAVLLAGRVPVNLNFTAGREAMSSAIQQCDLRTILTSRIFLDKAQLEEREGMVYLEEVMTQLTLFQKVRATLRAVLLPARWLLARSPRGEQGPDALATVLFSSGSTGVPKGVMLSHHNILSNIEGLAQIFWITRKDRIMGVLPFFHSFGFTGTLWFPLLAGFGVVYHANPLDAWTVGGMVRRYQATILLGTPAFYAAYLRKCPAEELASLRYAIVGAEKLREPLAQAFKEKYGLDLLEGYGCTEMAPVVSVNTPDVQQGAQRQTGLKRGTVGHPLPGVAVKIVDPESGAPLSAGQEGLLLVKGPNRMLGYLGQPEKSAEVFRNGWYVTGDIARIDPDGFLQITDRLARFSKIGGEMVPHIRVEEAIHSILGDPGCVVTAIPDEQKGERLVALYAHPEVAPGELWERLCRTDLPRLWIPKRENICRVEALPVLGTGKVDLQQARAIALGRAGEVNHGT